MFFLIGNSSHYHHLGFLNRVYWNSIKLFIIDLNKLINPNEDFGFYLD